MDDTKSPLNPNSIGYAVITLLISSASCAGTWLAYFASINMQATPISIPQDNELILLIVNIGWTVIFVIGSLSTWGMVISVATIVDVVYEINILTSVISKNFVAKLVVSLALFYLFMSMVIKADGFLSVFKILGNQAGALILGSILGALPAKYIVDLAQKVIRRRDNRDLTNNERVFWVLVGPVFLSCWFAILTLSLVLWFIVTIILGFYLTIVSDQINQRK